MKLLKCNVSVWINCSKFLLLNCKAIIDNLSNANVIALYFRNMTGLEYILLHVQEPILYVIRKQHRHSPVQTIPLADYYIIAGIVYQAPDLASVLNSRLASI